MLNLSFDTGLDEPPKWLGGEFCDSSFLTTLLQVMRVVHKVDKGRELKRNEAYHVEALVLVDVLDGLLFLLVQLVAQLLLLFKLSS